MTRIQLVYYMFYLRWGEKPGNPHLAPFHSLKQRVVHKMRVALKESFGVIFVLQYFFLIQILQTVIFLMNSKKLTFETALRSYSYLQWSLASNPMIVKIHLWSLKGYLWRTPKKIIISNINIFWDNNINFERSNNSCVHLVFFPFHSCFFIIRNG